MQRGEHIVVKTNGDIVDWSGAMDGVDTVIHLAGLAHFQWGIRGGSSRIVYEKLRDVNSVNARFLGQEAVRAGVRRVIFLSSLGAVATNSPEAITEATIPNPNSFYGFSKLAAELVLREELVNSGTELVIIRPPLVYGKGNIANMSRLIRLVKSGIPIPLASINNRRSFVGIENLISLIVHCIDSDRACGKPLLVSDGEDLATPDLMRMIAKISGVPCRLVPFPRAIFLWAGRFAQIDLFTKLCGDLFVDIEETKKRLGWIPRMGVEEGLRRVCYPDTVYRQEAGRVEV